MATRVDKLDYLSLDQHLSSSFYEQLEQSLKPIELRFGIFSLLKPEFRLLLNGYIYLNSVIRDGSTLGQKLLNLRLISTRSSSKNNLNKLQVYGLGFLIVLLPYIKERFSRSKLVNNQFTYLLEDVIKLAELLNFLVFLQKGSHPYLPLRLLFLDCELIEGKKRVELDYFLVNRNLLWSSISEVLSQVIQIVDFRRIKLLFKTHVALKLLPSKPLATNEKRRELRDYRICALCDDWPNNPHHFGCRHIFCYYCIYSDLLRLGGSNYMCPQCGYKIPDSSHIKQLYMTWK